MTRYIGIQHRVKMTAGQEAHPTRFAMVTVNPDKSQTFSALRDLKTEQDELDFILGRHPNGFRSVTPEDHPDRFHYDHIEWEEISDPAGVPQFQLEISHKITRRMRRVPIGYSGLQKDDTIAMILGGSGDYLAYALSRRAAKVGARVMRIPAFILKEKRGSDSKDNDPALLALLAHEEPKLFYPLAETDAALIRARESWRALWESMQARMAGELRLRQLYIGRAFTHPDGLYPEGGIENGFDALKASDPISKALRAEETSRERELVKALEELLVYRELFKPIVGVGPKIAARIIAAVIDIRRFETAAKLKKYMGVHVLPDGTFPRRRYGQIANWNGDARQALYLLTEQFNRRPDSYWGQYLRQMKANLRMAHPEPVFVEVKGGKGDMGVKKVKRYTDGHIHKMALWRTASRFVEWLHEAWTELETPRAQEEMREAA